MENARWKSKSLRPMRGVADQLKHIVDIFDLAANSRRCRILLLEAPVGSGKTRLLLESMLQAERRGFGVIDGIPDRSRSTNPHMTRIGQLETQINQLLRGGPVLVAVDDLQALDSSSVWALMGLVSKFAGVPLVWEFTLRLGSLDAPHGRLFDAISQDERAEWLQPLGWLPKSAIAEVIRDLLGAEPSRDLLSLCECFDATPKTQVELVQLLLEDDAIGIDEGIAILRTEESETGPFAIRPGVAPRVPTRFLALVSDRLARVSVASRQVLQVGAVLGRVFSPRDLLEILGRSAAELLEPLAEAVAAGMVLSNVEEFVFAHDLIWQAVLATVPPPLVLLLHRQAATMLIQRKGGHTQESAIHLLQCARPDDMETVETIARTAERLLPDAPDTAAALALRGMEVTRQGDRAHLTMAGIAMIGLLRAGRLNRAAHTAEQIMGYIAEETGAMADRLKAGLATVMALRGEADGALALVSPAERVAHGGDFHRTDLVRLVVSSFSNVEIAEEIAEGILADSAQQPADMTMAALSVRATLAWRQGRIDDALRTIEESVELWRKQSRDAFASYPLWHQAWMLLRVQQLDAADAVIESSSRIITASKVDVLVPVPLSLRAWYRFVEGDFTGAEVDASDALARCRRCRMLLAVPLLHALLALTALRRGELALASERLRNLDDSLPYDQLHPLWALRCLAAAQVNAACGEDEIALKALLAAGSCMQLVLADPTSAVWCVRLAQSTGHCSFAQEVVETVGTMTRANPHSPLLALITAHSRALLERNADTVKMVAAQYFDPWARASAAEDAGVLLRDVDHASAVSELSAAMAGYEALNADWDTARIRRRLRDLGVQRRHWRHKKRPISGWASLTEMEEKVARLAAGGLTNRQVARELFISPHTVGFHMRQIYRKLDIRSRVYLARVVPT